jgi:hypothetical protein
MLETYCNTKRNYIYIYIYYISSNVPRYTQDSIKTSISSFGVFTGLSRNTMAHPPVDLLSSTLLTLQPSMNQFIFAASQLLTVTHSTKSSLPGKTQTMHNHIQSSLPLFLSQPPQSIPVPPPLNPLPPFSPTVGQVVPTYSYITQQAPPPKLALSHQPPPPQNTARVRVRNLQSNRSRGRHVCFRCSDTDHLTSECRNALVRFSYNRLGYHSHQCIATTIFQPPPPKLTPKAAAHTNTLLW